MIDALPLVLAALTANDVPPAEQARQRWQAAEVIVVVEQGEGGPGELLQAAEQAAAAWNNVGAAPHLVLTVDEAPADDPLAVDGVNRIGLMREPWPYSAQAGTSPIAWTSATTDVIFEAVLALNPGFDFGDGTTGAYDLVSVLTHELGHLLGLDHLDDHPEATMFPLIPRGETKKRDLSDDDVAALLASYPSAPVLPAPVEAAPTLAAPADEADPERAEAPSRGCPQGSPPGAEGALALVLALAARRRRGRRFAASIGR